MIYSTFALEKQCLKKAGRGKWEIRWRKRKWRERVRKIKQIEIHRQVYRNKDVDKGSTSSAKKSYVGVISVKKNISDQSK